MMRSETARTYCVIPILENLMDVQRFQDFCTSKDIECSSSIVRGYAFSVVCVISYLIKRVTEVPNTLGLESDRLLERARFVGLPYYRYPHKSVTGKFARNLVELYRPFLGIESWEEFKESSSKISEYVLQPLKQAFRDGLKDASENKADKEFIDSALKYAAIWFTNYVLLDFVDVRMTYENAYKKGKKSWQRESVPQVIDKRHNFFEGYKLAIQYLLDYSVGPDYRKFKQLRKLELCEDWKGYNRLFSSMRAEVIAHSLIDFEKSNYLDSIFKSKNIEDAFKALTNSELYQQRPSTVEESLDELFMWYEAGMLDVGNNALGFITILKGYSSFGVDDIQVIKLTHPQQGVDGNNCSFAILIESSGLISDSSYWLLFYDFATDYSGNGSYCYRSVLEELNNLGERVHLIEASVDEEALSTYLESQRVRTLVTRAQNLVRLNDSLKGQFFELFVAHVLSRMGFATHLRYRNSQLLGKKEIDIISAKISNGKMNIIVAEAFGSFPKDTLEITKEMREKLLVVKQNYVRILRDIGITDDSKIISAPRIQGWVVTYDTTRRRRLSSNIFIYDINKLGKLCKDIGVNYNAFSNSLKKQKRQYYFNI